MTRTQSDHVAASRAIHRRTGKNFYVATKLFPARVRQATYALYGFFRVADDVVDDPEGTPPDEQRRDLARIRAAALGEAETDDPVLRAFRAVAEENGIDSREIETFIDAMEMDITIDGYADHEQLSTYLRGSAVAVAYMMLDVMGADDPEKARPHARALGEAFQLTNFLRDVREDVVEFDRVYLPESTLERFDVSRGEIESLTFSERFAAVMDHELRRTEQRYRKAVAGIEYLPRDCQFPVLLAAVLYAEHHRLIRQRGYDVLSARPTLSHPRRLGVAAKTWLRWKRTGDPVATFRAVSAVPTVDGGGSTPTSSGEYGRVAGSTDGGAIRPDKPSDSGWGCRSIRRRLGDLLP